MRAVPSTEASERRLAAILSADVAGYTRLMADDEAATVGTINSLRERIGVMVAQHRGRLVDFVGDNFLAEFPTATEALDCAVAIQGKIDQCNLDVPAHRRLDFRMGIHVGEIRAEADRIFGTGVNTASRLEALAEPGGICISRSVREQASARLGLTFQDLGERSLKDLPEPVQIFRVQLDSSARRSAEPFFALRRPGWRTIAVFAATFSAIAGLSVGGWQLLSSPEAPGGAKADEPANVSIGVMSIQARGEVPQWQADFTRDGLNTVLGNISHFRVYSKQKIDFLKRTRKIEEIEVAESLGLDKMISGSISSTNERLTVHLDMVDIETGVLDDSTEITATTGQLVGVQNRAVIWIIDALSAPVQTDDLLRLLELRTEDQGETYRLVTQSMGGFVDEEPEATREKRRIPGAQGRSSWVSQAYAADPEPDPRADDQAVRALLEDYRRAIVQKRKEDLETLFVEVSPQMEQAHTTYFDSTTELMVEFSDYDILVAGDEALATFTRRDDFIDASGKEHHLEIRISSLLERDGSGWRIRGLKRP